MQAVVAQLNAEMAAKDAELAALDEKIATGAASDVTMQTSFFHDHVKAMCATRIPGDASSASAPKVTVGPLLPENVGDFALPEPSASAQNAAYEKVYAELKKHTSYLHLLARHEHTRDNKEGTCVDEWRNQALAGLGKASQAAPAAETLAAQKKAIQTTWTESDHIEEKRDVQPFVAEVFKRVVEHVQADLQGRAAQLALYVEAERPRSDDNAFLRPDILVHLHGQQCELTWCTRRAGIMPQASQTVLNAYTIELALEELERDLALMLPAHYTTAPLPERVGVMSDGRSWFFVTTRIVVAGVLTHSTQVSAEFKMEEEASMVAFMRLMHTFIEAAIVKPVTYTLPPLPRIRDIDVTRALSASSRRANIVVSGELGGRGVVLKFPGLLGRKGERWRMETQAWEREWLGEVPNLIRLHADWKKYAPALLLFDHASDGWHSLEEQCVCAAMTDAAFAAFVAAIETQIGAALHKIHDNGCAFVDVHPGNIVTDGTTFLLIDIESMVPLNTTTSGVVARADFTPKRAFTATKETDLASLAMVVEHLEAKRSSQLVQSSSTN